MAVRGTVDAGAGGTLVTSVTGTANQVTASPTTGAVVVGLAAIAQIATSLAIAGATIGTDALGVTGTATVSGLVTLSSGFTFGGGGATVAAIGGAQIRYALAASSSTTTLINVVVAGSGLVAASGIQAIFTLAPTVTQTSTAGYSMLVINPTESSTGSGVKLLAQLQVGSVNKLIIDNAGLITSASATLFATSAALTNNAAAQAGTLLNSPTAGNPTKWIPINDNGTVRNIPAW